MGINYVATFYMVSLLASHVNSTPSLVRIGLQATNAEVNAFVETGLSQRKIEYPH